jgi:hypothetical protein
MVWISDAGGTTRTLFLEVVELRTGVVDPDTGADAEAVGSSGGGVGEVGRESVVGGTLRQPLTESGMGRIFHPLSTSHRSSAPSFSSSSLQDPPRRSLRRRKAAVFVSFELRNVFRVVREGGARGGWARRNGPRKRTSRNTVE